MLIREKYRFKFIFLCFQLYFVLHLCESFFFFILFLPLFLSFCYYIQVLITIYWLGRKAQSDPFYTGPQLNLKAFEGLLGTALSKVFTFDVFFFSSPLLLLSFYSRKCNASLRADAQDQLMLVLCVYILTYLLLQLNFTLFYFSPIFNLWNYCKK